MLSIIVPARNNPESTTRCLSSLLYCLSSLKLACEFILIDDNSAPEENILDVFLRHRAEARGHETRIVRARNWQHYTGVFSIGLHLSTRDAVFFISNDMVVTPSFLQAVLMVSALSRDFGIVRGCSPHTDSHPEHTIVPARALATFDDANKFAAEIFQSNGARFAEDHVLSGDAVLVKRALIEKIGVLDLRFFGYFGDPDYGMRAHLAGFKLVCAKGAWLFHEGAGHVKREAAKTLEMSFDGHHNQRMALVEKAYQQFREKWSADLPDRYADLSKTQYANLHFFDLARQNAHKVPLKYDFPASLMDELEFH